MKALIRQQLAATLWVTDPANTDPDDLVEALLPLVEDIAKQYAADALRAAAEGARVVHPDSGWCVTTHALNDRAEALEAGR